VETTVDKSRLHVEANKQIVRDYFDGFWVGRDPGTAYQQLGVMPAGPAPAPLKLIIGARGKLYARKKRKQASGAAR